MAFYLTLKKFTDIKIYLLRLHGETSSEICSNYCRFLWAIIQPVVTLLILSLVFGRFVGVNTGIPHILFTVAGQVWAYFSYVMTNSGNSIISAQAMIKKIYFPRLIVPLSKAVVGLY